MQRSAASSVIGKGMSSSARSKVEVSTLSCCIWAARRVRSSVSKGAWNAVTLQPRAAATRAHKPSLHSTRRPGSATSGSAARYCATARAAGVVARDSDASRTEMGELMPPRVKVSVLVGVCRAAVASATNTCISDATEQSRPTHTSEANPKVCTCESSNQRVTHRSHGGGAQGVQRSPTSCECTGDPSEISGASIKPRLSLLQGPHSTREDQV